MGRTALFSRKQPGGVFTIEHVDKTPGAVFFVHAGTGTDGAGYGRNPDSPVATIDYAVGLCAANKGDVIYVLPGHAETVAAAAGIDADVAGISIVGLGAGENRPIVTFATATGADVDVDAADITIRGIVFKVNVDSLAAPIDVNAKDFTLEDCEFREGSAKQWLTCVDLDGGAANAVDRATIRRCKFVSYTAGADNAIKLAEVADEVTIADCVIDGDFADAGIHNPTGKILTNLRLLRNVIRNRQTGDHAIELVSACTGEAVDNRLFGDTAAAVFDPGSLFTAANQLGTAIDEESLNVIALWPAAAAAANGKTLAAVLRYLEDALIGTAGVVTYPAAAVPGNGVSLAEVLRDAWDALRNGTGGSEPGTNKSIVDAIGFDGAAAVAATAGMLRVANGTRFVVKKTLTSSAVVQAGVDVTAVSTVGDVLIEDFVLQTDGTGLAAGTNFTLETNNAKGTAVFCSHAVGSLGAQVVVDKKAASTGKGVVLESGKKIIAKCTVADCTGVGTIDVYLLCRRLADNATLAAA